MEPRLQELVALAGLAAFGCGLALEVGDLLFAAFSLPVQWRLSR
jgi:hypothetical protein